MTHAACALARHRPGMAWRRVACLFTLGLLAGTTLAAPPARVSASVAAQAALERPVEVLILLDDAAEQAQLRAAVGTPAKGIRPSRAEHDQVVATRALLLGSLKANVLLSAAEPELEVLTDYGNLPIVHARIRSARALENLRRQGKIRSIDAIVATRASLVQSLPLIGQPEVQGAGHLGAGTTVAVLDTGVDYTRAAFGACGSPGGACKVAHAQDFATPDGVLDSTGHGTNVAGTVLGVAPGARIAALDVFESNGLAYSNVIINAINWCITNQVAYNIVAINMSLGGGRHYSALAPSDAWGSAIASAIDAGIVVVAASGNNGYIDSMSSPAAYSNAVSVGAYYDSAMGSMGWSGCSDTSTAAGKITCFSNSANFLTLAAPGAMISAAGITMGGTSQATPHVAGAVAVLRGSYTGDSVAQTVDRLKLGGGVTDHRNGVTVPALALTSSMAVPPSTYRLTVARSGSGSVLSTPSAIDCGGSCVADIGNGDSVTLTALHGAGAMFTGWSGACLGSATSCTLTMSVARSASASFVTRSSEDFPAGGSLPPSWTQPGGSAAAWAGTGATAFVGGLSLQAGSVGHGQSSIISHAGRFAAGRVSFARRVSSQGGSDYLHFYIDDVLQGSWAGELPWAMVSFPITAGLHTLKWAYVKDGAGASGSDTAWIDSVNLPLAAADSREARTDFNGDGRSDILWVDSGSGAVALWLMDGNARQSGASSLGTVSDLQWKAVTSGDFNGDGKADVLWRHAASGQNSIWLMDGATRLPASGQTVAIGDAQWRVAGSGDFDGDGKTDLLWRHAGSGANTVWLMDGTTRRAGSGAIAATADLNWRVVGVADFNADGKADILWRHGETGANSIWFMDGMARLPETGAIHSIADLNWRVAATGDFNGDGKADILWRHGRSGANSIWFMDGRDRLSGTGAIAATADLNWRVAGAADFNADGMADILWRHAKTGANSIWFMDGRERLSGWPAAVDKVGTRWQVVAPQAAP